MARQRHGWIYEKKVHNWWMIKGPLWVYGNEEIITGKFLTSGRQNVLDKDEDGLLSTELYPLPDNIDKLPDSQISRNQISARIKIYHITAKKSSIVLTNPQYRFQIHINDYLNVLCINRIMRMLQQSAKQGGHLLVQTQTELKKKNNEQVSEPS